jgi:twitching motility two-component system response regulator PilG
MPAPSLRILVAEDDASLARLYAAYAESRGHTVLFAQDGAETLVTAASELPDLVLLDIAMPKLDGYEVCKRIKKDPRTAHVPVLMLSGKDALFDKVKGHMAGATEYLTKPFETPAVLAAVSNACQPSEQVVHG